MQERSDGTTPNTTPVTATNDWWGLRTGSVSLPNPGPAVWPDIVSPPATTSNPPVPENPVNGSPVADPACPGGVSDSSAVTFCPYRDSDQPDSVNGELPIPDAPGPATEPTGCTNGVQLDPNIPSYDSFFGTTLGSGTTGDGLSGPGQRPGHGSAGVRVQHRLRGQPGHAQSAPRPGR